MKTTLLFLSFVVTLSVSAQRAGMSFFANLESPDKHYMPKMSNGFGGGLELLVRTSPKIPLFASFSYSGSYYALETINTTYYFPDGGTTKTDVSYSSGLKKFLFGLRLTAPLKEAAVVPYVSTSLGAMTMRSRISIEDPEEGGCEPLENKVVFSRTGFIYTAGAGIMLNKNVFCKKESCFKSFIDAGCYFTGGSRMEYINVNYMKDEPQGPATHNGTPATESERDYYAQFVNVNTNSIHEHKIAEVYKTPLSLWTFRIAYTVMF